nr:translation initiation factor IF-2-like [Chlorocebus sabaeus]
MAGLRVPAFNAGGRPITSSHAETQPPETTSSGMHREPLSSTSVAPCASQCRETTGPGMPCAPRAQRPEAVGVRVAPPRVLPRVPPRVQPGPHAAGAAVVFSSSDLPFDAEAQGQVRRPRPAQAVGRPGARRPEAPGGLRKSERPQREGGQGAWSQWPRANPDEQQPQVSY